jgi:hypothetical protein
MLLVNEGEPLLPAAAVPTPRRPPSPPLAPGVTAPRQLAVLAAELLAAAPGGLLPLQAVAELLQCATLQGMGHV